jgi:hypothetical protein
MGDKLKNKLIEFINSPYDLNVNLDLGYLYEKENQYASAVSHYMRGAEYGLDSNSENKFVLISECLFRAAEVFIKLGSRIHSTKTIVLHAISNTPELPQLYLLLSKIYETTGDWHECNAACNIGLNNLSNYIEFRYDARTEEDTINELLFQKAVSNYYIGKTNKARVEFALLKSRSNLKEWMINAIDNSLKTIGKPVLYNQIGYEKIVSSKDLFKDNNFVSFSQCLQDVIVSSIFKNGGHYLEIGSGDPFKNNNTYLLERDHNWKGISIDNDKEMVNKFNSSRKNKAIAADAREVNYKEILKDFPKDIEYLQLDCEPPEVTLETLYKIPFDEYRFAFITFEHDAYRTPEVKSKSREYLSKLGYELLISDVSYNGENSWEDWWVHPELINNYVDSKTLSSVKNTTNDINGILNIFI